MTNDMWQLLQALINGDVTAAEYDQQVDYLVRWQ